MAHRCRFRGRCSSSGVSGEFGHVYSRFRQLFYNPSGYGGASNGSRHAYIVVQACHWVDGDIWKPFNGDHVQSAVMLCFPGLR
ncbi:hypothetical protein OUZ56_016370 [Daphnia magna]|uniref:Uncharacterized protein n=1 Tax=Daphnia magna TaxID=35525 RepID=A0ABR0AQF9_9CRUS|nr:hypothetical protein OUZ56_016370 [Daphnia magna]